MALNSTTNLQLVDIIGEGPIEGLATRDNPLRSIFLDETQAPGRTDRDETEGKTKYNFEFKEGTPKQLPFSDKSGFKDNVTAITDVGVQVGANYSEEVDENNQVTEPRNYGQGVVVRTITDLLVDDIELIFTVPTLYCQGMERLAKGQLLFAQIKVQVAVQAQGKGYEPVDLLTGSGVVNGNTIKGISTSNYQVRTQPINVQSFGPGPWKIRVKKQRFKNNEDAFEVQFEDFEDISKKTPLANTRADTLIWTSILTRKNIKTNY